MSCGIAGPTPVEPSLPKVVLPIVVRDRSSSGLNVRVERLAGNYRFQTLTGHYARQKSVSSDFGYPPRGIIDILLGGYDKASM
jgi:hypothetical protein